MVAYSCSFSTPGAGAPRLIEAKIILGYDPPGLLKNSLTRKEGQHTRPADTSSPQGGRHLTLDRYERRHRISGAQRPARWSAPGRLLGIKF